MSNARFTSLPGLTHAVLSDIGLRRANNQDSYAIVLANTAEMWQTRGHIFLVADGMGAHAAGELASKLAADTIPQTYRKHTELPPAEALLTAFAEANAVIHGRGQANAEFHGMGTTASALLILPQGAFVGHVGDSRVYRLRGQQFDQLTFDHSLVWEVMSSAQLDENAAPPHLPKNIITRSLGPAIRVEVDREGPFPMQPGDTFLLCTDGLSGQVTDDELGQILETLPPDEAAQALVDLANLRGGPDNITVIVVRVDQPPVSAPSAPAPRLERRESATGTWVFATLSAIAALATVVFAWGRVWTAAALGGGAAALFALLAVFSRGEKVAYHEPPTDAFFGRGPHRTRTCTPNKEFADRLAETTEQLRQAATDESWTIDWNRFQSLTAEARQANEGRQFDQAIRSYCRAISFMMHQLRQQRNKSV
jgi:protein phosphatase